MGALCVFGDSITWGAWDVEKGGWVNRLRLFIDKENLNYRVFNCGVGGDTTKELVARFSSEMAARQLDETGGDIIIFSVGCNDSLYYQNGRLGVSKLEFKKNLELLGRQARKFSKAVIFLGIGNVDERKTRPVPWNEDANYANNGVREYNKFVETLAKRNHFNFVPIFGLLKSSDLADGLHPNSRGHEKIFRRVKNFLKKNKFI